MNIIKWLQKSRLIRTGVILLILLVGIVLIWPHEQYPSVSFPQVAQDVAYGRVASITIQNDNSKIIVAYKPDLKPDVVISRLEPGLSLYEGLQKYGVTQEQLQRLEIVVQTQSRSNNVY